MNPFQENPHVLSISEQFYRKFYDDKEARTMILGINPGRLGAGATGIPFTDTKRLASHCEIVLEGLHTHEPSSVFVYKVIDAFGGVKDFYKKFYINSISPLGFIAQQNGKTLNYNYYDSKALTHSVKPFVVASLKKQIEFGIRRDACICFGTGKNLAFLKLINDEFGFFEKIIPLEHPRYVMQYKSKQMDVYLNNYLTALYSLV